MSENYFMGLDGFVWFTGVVEDRNDPDKLGRVRVRCLGFHTENLVDIPTADLPWAHVMHPVTDPSMQGMGNTPSFLVEGTWVVGFFTDAKEKQQPIIMGTLPGKPSTAPDDTKGFSDPNKVYPSLALPTSGHGTDKEENNYSTETKFFESDTNRLARNDDALVGWDEKEEANTPHSMLKAKEDARTKNIPIANTTDDETDSKQQEWSEQTSTYAAVYPKNHVFETESGHIKEYDDTTDAERIHEYHKSGTFTEIAATGNKHTRIVGTNYEIIAGSDYVNVKGDVFLTIDSNCKTYIKGDWDIQVDGNKTEVVKKNVTETYGTENTEHSHTVSVTGKRAETVSNTVTETYEDAKTETVTGAVSETYKANQTTNITGTLDLDASTEVDIDAGVINLN
tara:strand:- start:1295 stop:2479 length:1185 start_codon:yes stop_codon:yes gene_type:complete